ncbi:MAG TPA: DUF1616 domain-containing protein [Solirubrobacterales bacterium]|nr:DUF1616 domain-containing protein [Solirubrobacterales bacterium]
MRGHRDLRLVGALALACALLALAIPWTGPSLVFAAPLLLFLPGYAVTAAAFGRRQLERPQMLLLAIALSLAVLTLGSLLLNYLGGIHPLSWALLELLVVLASCRVAAVRRGNPGGPPRWRLPRPRGVEAAMLLGAAAAAIVALVLSASAVPAGDALGYTQLWILPKAGSGGSEAVVGVRSQEQRSADFDLRIRIGTERVLRRSFRLAPGEGRQVRLRAPTGGEGEVPVVATLLRHNRPFAVYRRVRGSLSSPGETR